MHFPALPLVCVWPLLGLATNGIMALLTLVVGLIYLRYRTLKLLALYYASCFVFFLGYTLSVFYASGISHDVTPELVLKWYAVMMLGIAWIPMSWVWVMQELVGRRSRVLSLMCAVVGAGTPLVLLLFWNNPYVLSTPLEFVPSIALWRPTSEFLRPLLYFYVLVIITSTLYLLGFKWWRGRHMPGFVKPLVWGLGTWMVTGVLDTLWALELIPWPDILPWPTVWAGSIGFSIFLAAAAALYFKELDRQLKATQRLYQGVVEDQTELICRFKPGGTLTFVNKAYCDYFGTSPQQILGKSFYQFLPEEERKNVEQRLKGLSLENPTITYEHKVIKPDGSIAWQQWTDRAIFDEQGRVIEYQSVGRDITRLKQTEQELRKHKQRLEELVRERTKALEEEIEHHRRTEQALRESRANLETLFNSMQDMLLVLAMDGRIIAVNQPVTSALGTSRWKLIGKQLCSLLTQPMDEPTIETIKNLKEGDGLIWEGEFARSSGALPVEVRFTRSSWSHQAVILAIARDITERKRAEQTLKQLTAGVAHNFNNILAAILSNAEAILSRCEDGPMVELARSIITSAETGRDVVKRLGGYVGRLAKPAPGESVDLAEVLRLSLEMGMADQKNLPGMKLVTHWPQELRVCGRKAELVEVFVNLVRNALEAMDGQGKLELTATRRSGWIEVRVSDTGKGMDEEVLRRAFEPFFTTKGVKGQGLGLATSRGLLWSMGGHISIESTPGKGTTVIVRLRESKAAPAAAPQTTDTPQHSLKGVNVLLVEDEPLVAGGLATLLELAGCQVRTATTVAQAKELISTSPPEVLVCDLGLPDGSGWEVVRTLARIAPQARCIVLTGWLEVEQEARLPEEFVYTVVHKPVSGKNLVEEIRKILAR